MLLPFAIVAAIMSTGTIPMDQFHWQGHIRAGQSIEIKGVYGSIRAEPASGDRAEVVASETTVEMIQSPEGIVFRAQQPASARIDFTVRVPKGVRFIGRTVNGSVEA